MAKLVFVMRWVIPLFVAFLGSTFALYNSRAIHAGAFSVADLVSTIWIPGFLIPSLCWLLLTWFTHRMQSVINVHLNTALDNARRLAESQRRVASLETASLLGQQVVAHLEMDTLLAEMVGLVREKLNCYQAHILLVDEENQELVLKKSSGRSDVSLANQDLRLKIGEEGITGWVAQTGQTLLCNDVSCEPRYLPVDFAPASQSELAVPLRIGNRVIGVLDVQSDARNAFDQDDVAVLQILGNQVGRAIENARLYHETKYRYEAMIALHDTSLDMIAQLDTPKLLEALLRRGAHLLGARFSSLFLYDAANGSIRNVANFNSWRDWTGVTLEPGQGAIGQVILTGKPLIVNDYGNWPHRQVLESTPHTMVMCAPLRWQEQIIGGIGVVSEPNAHPFNQNDLWLLSLFADLASIAIKNAELHTQIKQFNQELEQKVAARTRELSNAKDQVAIKADQLRSLWAETIRVQENERARIARDMHDDVVQLITATRLELDAAEIIARPELKLDARDKLVAARDLLDEMEKQIRRAIYNLHPPSLDAVGLVPAMQNYIHRFRQISGIDCRMEVTGKPVRLFSQSENSIYHMIEAALSNVVAHAEATATTVIFDFQSALLLISVSDNGHGFDYPRWMQEAGRSGQHLGLLGMRERVEGLGGRMDVESTPGHGTCLRFKIPI